MSRSPGKIGDRRLQVQLCRIGDRETAASDPHLAVLRARYCNEVVWQDAVERVSDIGAPHPALSRAFLLLADGATP